MILIDSEPITDCSKSKRQLFPHLVVPIDPAKVHNSYMTLESWIFKYCDSNNKRFWCLKNQGYDKKC